MQSNLEAGEPGELTDSYALVAYIPGPLGKFLDELRKRLVPSCIAQSHISVLPPRPLAVSDEEAKGSLETWLADIGPFSMELQDVSVFESTDVIYLSVGAGARELKALHDRLNQGSLFLNERFTYHPHVTLAQDFPTQEIEELVQVARDLWAEFRHDRTMLIESLTFVKKRGDEEHWLDLRDFPLGEPVPAALRR